MEHTCKDHLEDYEPKRAANFPLASEDLVKYISTTVFKDPRILVSFFLKYLLYL